MVRFPPPKSHDTFCPPLAAFQLFNRGKNRRPLRLPAEGGDHIHCTVEPSPSDIRFHNSKPLQNGK